MVVSDSFRFPASNFIKKDTRGKIFFCEFCKNFKNMLWPEEHLWMTASSYLWILRSFSEHLFYRAPLGNCLFHVQDAEVQPAYTVKNHFTGGPWACNFIKKRLQHRCFPVNIAKFLRTPILKNICEQVFLKPVFSPGLPFLITYILAQIGTYTLVFVS